MERFDREPLRGFVAPQSYLQPAGIELLNTNGNVVAVGYEEVKAVCFVKDIEGDGLQRARRHFTTRPKSEGLWVRMIFRDGDYLDGLLPNKLLELDPNGFAVAPPDSAANSQWVFVPRAALTELKVLGIIGSPLRRRWR